MMAAIALSHFIYSLYTIVYPAPKIVAWGKYRMKIPPISPHDHLLIAVFYAYKNETLKISRPDLFIASLFGLCYSTATA